MISQSSGHLVYLSAQSPWKGSRVSLSQIKEKIHNKYLEKYYNVLPRRQNGFKIFYFILFIFREREKEGVRKGEIHWCVRDIIRLPLSRPQLGTWPATQALAGNHTDHLLVRRLALNLLSCTSQGSFLFFETQDWKMGWRTQCSTIMAHYLKAHTRITSLTQQIFIEHSHMTEAALEVWGASLKISPKFLPPMEILFSSSLSGLPTHVFPQGTLWSVATTKTLWVGPSRYWYCRNCCDDIYMYFGG